MKTYNQIETEYIDEYNDDQYEYSVEIADRLVDEEIIPFLEEFDYDNPEEDYVPGVATFTLFARVVEMLLIDGFQVDQLKQVIDEFSATNVTDSLH